MYSSLYITQQLGCKLVDVSVWKSNVDDISVLYYLPGHVSYKQFAILLQILRYYMKLNKHPEN